MKAYSRLRWVTLMMALTVLALMVTASLPVRAAGPWYVAPGGNDGNDCLSPATPCATINGAIAMASSGDTIYVAAGTYTGSGDQVVLLDQDAILSGGWDADFVTQSGTSTIDGEHARRGIVTIDSVTASVDFFVVRNGYSHDAEGGGIASEGTLTLSNCTISDNWAGSNGGGISNGWRTMTLNNCTVDGNTAPGGGGIFQRGGGGTLILNSSTVSGNTATASNSSGGGIASDGTLTLNDSVVRDNSAEMDGGGISSSGPMTLTGSTVSGNTASGYYSGGGGISSVGPMTLTNSTVSGNTATGYGGGIDHDGDGGTMRLDGCTVHGNTAHDGGGINSGGTMTLTNSTVTGNTAAWNGGGIRHAHGALTLNGSTVNGNTAEEVGGGIHYAVGTLTLNGSTIGGNSARGSGGGIATDVSCEVILNNSTVSGNTAESDGGGISNGGNWTILFLNSTTISQNSADREGGGVFNAAGGTATLRNTILSGNTSAGGSPDCSGEIDSAGYSLVGNTSGCEFASTTGDLLDVDPRLFPPLIGLPGYHPLRPGSPAIDAGNPAGCTDHLGNPLDTDQRGTPRPLDGNGDGNAICDMGAYEVDPEHPIVQAFLPCVTLDYYSCPNFFDDFSDPTSGWDVVDDEFVRSQYANGEFRILTKQAGYFYLFRAPTCDRQNYVVEADARWVGTPGSSYGLIFGITSGYEQFYLYDMNTDYRQFRLFRADPGGLTVLVPPTYAAAIQGGTASNHLKVIRNGDQITLAVNGTVLGTWSDGTIGGETGAGLVTNPYHDIPTSDARFDNFSIAGLPSSGALAQEPSGLMAEERELAAPNARRVPVPVDMGW